MSRIGFIEGIKFHSGIFKRISKLLSEMKSVVLDSARKNNGVYSTVLPGYPKISEENSNRRGDKFEEQESMFGEIGEKSFPLTKGEILSVKLFYSHLQSAVEMERNLYISSTPSSSSSSICTASSPRSSIALLSDVTDKYEDPCGSRILPCSTDSHIKNISDLKFEDTSKSEIVAIYDSFLELIAECLS